MSICTNIKKSTLCTLPISGIILYFYATSINNIYIRICMTFINSVIIFINFPMCIKMLHTKPVYYEDILIIDKYASQTNPYHLQSYFLYINGITTIIFVVISIEYLYQASVHNAYFINTIGTLGGLNVLYSKIQMYFGKTLLSILYYIKNKKYSIAENPSTFVDVENQVSTNMNMPWLWAWHHNTQPNPTENI